VLTRVVYKQEHEIVYKQEHEIVVSTKVIRSYFAERFFQI